MPKDNRPDIRQIVGEVADELGSSRRSILSPTRGRPEDAWARAAAMWVYRSTHGGEACTFAEVGRAFDRDRTTARHAIKRVVSRISNSPVFDAAMGRILEKL